MLRLIAEAFLFMRNIGRYSPHFAIEVAIENEFS